MILASMAASIAACSLDDAGIGSSGLPDAGDGGSSVDVRAGDAPGHDARVADVARDALPDSPHAADAPGVDTSGGPCPTPPDCSNAACKSQGYLCTPPAPSGWTLAAVDLAGGTTCPPGYGTAFDVYTPPTGGSAECGCSCTVGSLPSCTTGGIVFSSGGDSSCSSGSNTKNANDGSCTPTTTSIAAHIKVTSLPTETGGTCSEAASSTLPPNGSTSEHVCPVSGPASTLGCSGGNVCVATTSEYSRCVLQPGAPACPGAYSVTYDVGVGVDDTRACSGACTCGEPTATCGDQTWTYYADGICGSGGSFAISLDGNCDATGLPDGNMFYSYQYTASPVGTACGSPTATPTATGSLSLTDPHSLCCLPP
jgi:hypothetical protein